MKLAAIEKHILSRPGNWTFDSCVSKVFDTHIRKSVPCYDEIQKLIAGISQKLLTKKAVVYDLGTATGEIIHKIYNANKAKEVSFFGIDQSVHMLKIAKKKCCEIKNVTFYNEKIETFTYSPSDLIIAAFTLQFVDIEFRKQLLQKIRNALKANGSFILCEKVFFENNQVNQLYKSVHENWKLNFFSEQEIISKRKSLTNVMKLLTLSEYNDLLRTVGFTQINPFFQWCNFICILAT